MAALVLTVQEAHGHELDDHERRILAVELTQATFRGSMRAWVAIWCGLGSLFGTVIAGVVVWAITRARG